MNAIGKETILLKELQKVYRQTVQRKNKLQIMASKEAFKEEQTESPHQLL